MVVHLLSRSSSIVLIELERRANKSMLIKHALGGLLPGFPGEILQTHDVLEIGCGPGTWSLDLAQTYCHMKVMGIDAHALMIFHANTQALHQSNVHYLQVPNLAGLFSFAADTSFDVISIQFLGKDL